MNSNHGFGVFVVGNGVAGEKGDPVTDRSVGQCRRRVGADLVFGIYIIFGAADLK